MADPQPVQVQILSCPNKENDVKKLKSGQYVFEMTIPVTVQYSKREDGSVSIDSTSVPDEDILYRMVDKHAKEIKTGAEIRI